MAASVARSSVRQANGSTRRYTKDDWTDFVHTGPGTLAGRYLRMFWQPVCRSEDLGPGRTKPIRVMSEDFTLYRSEESASAESEPHAHLLAFRCAHRGTQLSAGWVEGDSLRCYYHGWKYDASGQCIEQPGEREPFCQKIRVESYPIREYIGLIFAYLGEGEPPPVPRIPELEHDCLIENWHEDWPINYFNRIENAPDSVHVPFVHHHHGTPIPLEIDGHETDYGYEAKGIRFYMPNMSYFPGSSPAPHIEAERTRHKFMWRIPVDDSSHLVLGAQRVNVTGEAVGKYLDWRRQVEAEQESIPMEDVARDVLAGKIRSNDIHKIRKWDTSSVQDFTVLTGQGVIADREHEHLGSSDVGIILLRKIWVGELRALAEGRSMKQWTVTQPLLVPRDGRLRAGPEALSRG
ncbi:MAG: hypothetical protein HW416_80 [Chloroflexi bacterium]|nr:hypothetical protein [Chloroflexota bacterium]